MQKTADEKGSNTLLSKQAQSIKLMLQMEGGGEVPSSCGAVSFDLLHTTHQSVKSASTWLTLRTEGGGEAPLAGCGAASADSALATSQFCSGAPLCTGGIPCSPAATASCSSTVLFRHIISTRHHCWTIPNFRLRHFV